MEFWVQIKTIGKRKIGLEKVKYEMPEIITDDLSLKQFISHIVKKEIASYQKKTEQTGLFSLLSGEELEDGILSGKVTFGTLYRKAEVDEAKAIACALQSFEDGEVRIFQNDKVLDCLDQQLHISSNDVFTFIRLTFLAGRLF